MAGREIQRVQIPDEKINRALGNIIDPLNQLLQVPYLSGVLLENVVLAIGNNNIPHKLARSYQGYLILRQNAAASIFNNQAVSVDSKSFIPLNSSAVVTINLWVF